MTSVKITIRPRRSMAVFAILSIVMVVLSYVVLLTLAAGCVCLPYLALDSGHANFQVLALLLFGIAIAGALLWSMVPRLDKFEAPGPLLERGAHPRLFAELDDIANSLDENLPHEVYLIGDMNAFVADRGGIMGFGSRRIMGLGLPLLALLNISEFRAVLAHEFAHYYGGDTRLGPWVYKTRMAIIRVFQSVGTLDALARLGILRIAYLFVTTLLKWYFKFFMTITNLISRRQEFRADELACLVAGPQPLIAGLRTINGAGPAWPAYWQTEIAPLLESGTIPGLGDGFAQFVARPAIAVQVTAIMNSALLKPKSHPYDTHPPLRERIAAAEKLPALARTPETQPASTLLENPRETELNLVRTLFPVLSSDTLTFIPWDRVVNDVRLPNWKKAVATYANLLQGITAESLPQTVAKLAELGAQIRDPKGTLLTRGQRTERAAELLAISFALALLNHGWQMSAPPEVMDLQRGDARLNPFVVVREIMSGKTRAEDWVQRCRTLGISEYSLAAQPPEALRAVSNT
jgi:heat shock protein HtpX